jgi:hypothetical protein
MPEDQFWSFIDLLGGSPGADSVSRLTDALRSGGKATAIGFAESLAAVLHELDREVLVRRTIRWADAPDQDPIPLSDDTFLYLRCAVVAAGRATVDAVLADPAVLESRLWDDGEGLLHAAGEAAGDEIDTELSYETGSNTEHWTPRPDDDGPAERPLVAVLLADLLDPIEGWDGETGEPLVEYAWPMWLPQEVSWDVSTTASRLVGEGGGLPPLGAEQVVVSLEFGEVWQAVPAVDGLVDDELGLEQMFRVRAQLAQDVVRSWSAEQQTRGLLAVAAGCLLAVLPSDHGARQALQQATEDGAELLPSA